MLALRPGKFDPQNVVNRSLKVRLPHPCGSRPPVEHAGTPCNARQLARWAPLRVSRSGASPRGTAEKNYRPTAAPVAPR